MNKIKFLNFIQDYETDKSLNEALDSPVEFYMTDDTKMPNEIYAAFQVSESDYGMSLIKSQWKDVYVLELYYIVNKKRRKWRVKQKGDLKYCLSSVIKFFEACQPFLGNKLKGIIMDLPTAKDSERYVNLLGRIIKKSHIKTYREVPVVKSSDKSRNYLFMIKKTIQPEQLFKSVTFSKHFIFDKNTSEVSMDSEAMDMASELYKNPKQTVSTEPSDMLAFGKLKVQATANKELLDALDMAVYKFNLAKLDKADKPSSDINTPNVKFTQLGTEVKNIMGMRKIPQSVLFAYLLPDGYKNINKYGFDESKFNEGNANYVLNQNFVKLPESLKESIIQNTILDKSGRVNFGNIKDREVFFKNLKNFANIEESEITKLKDLFGKVQNAAAPTKAQPAEKLDLNFEVISNVDAFSTSNDSVALQENIYTIPFKEKDENIIGKKSVVYKMPSVQKWFSDPDKSKVVGYKKLVQYTGPSAFSWNGELRDMFKTKKLNFNDINEDIQKLMKYFITDAPKLGDAIWTYRNADLPEHYNVGEDIIDSAFLSTSIRSTMDLGDEGNSRMKIYLPKGTKCFPILDESKHSNENEILLPPTSVLKIIEKEVVESGKVCYTCIMLGSVNESLVESGSDTILLENAQNKEGEDLMTEAQKNKNKNKDKVEELDYNPEDKWGAPMGTRETSRSLKRAINSKKLKVRN